MQKYFSEVHLLFECLNLFLLGDRETTHGQVAIDLTES